MRTVYRVEQVGGGGPYCGRYRRAIDGGDAMFGCNHPGPREDRELGFLELDDQDPWVFGFATLTQYRAWMHTARLRRGLKAAGFYLREYRVPDQYMRRSNFQAIFNRDYAELVAQRETTYRDKE